MSVNLAGRDLICTQDWSVEELALSDDEGNVVSHRIDNLIHASATVNEAVTALMSRFSASLWAARSRPF